METAMRAGLVCAVLTAIAAIGCSSSRPPPGDVGFRVDAATADDAAANDAAMLADAARRDASATDAAIATDAATDAARATDAATARDAGTDAASTTDGGGGCSTTRPCSGAMEYCHAPDGTCGATGTCTTYAAGMICPALVAPVCGCNGMTYSNYCYAARAGQSIAHAGACATAGCRTNADCTAMRFCQYPNAACGGTGTCQSRGLTLLCVMTCTPECGCDGVSYRNACYRRKRGTSLASPGTCPGATPPC